MPADETTADEPTATDGSRSTDPRVRVLWLIKGLGPGGAEQLLVNQARVRNRARFEYRAAYLVPWKNHRVATLEELGVPVLLLDGARELDPRWLWRLRRSLIDDPVDVIHHHSPLVASATRVLVRTLPRQKRPALVYTEHNRWPRHNRFTRLANRLTYRLDDVHLAVSDDVRDTIPPRLRERTRVLTHGIVLDDAVAAAKHREDVRAELGIGEDDVVIGTVANYRREKDYPTMLDAARRAVDEAGARGVQLRFVAIGQGPLQDEITARHRELELDDRFLLLGYKEDAVRWMSAFDVFTLSSIHEGLPVALMDALALGLPVVATDVGGIPQAVQHDVEGLLVPPHRPDLLATAYLTVAADADRRAAMAAHAATRAEEFDIAVTTRALEEIYVAAAHARRR